MNPPIDWARISAVLALFAGMVVLRALHDLSASDFNQFATLLVGAVLGSFAQIRPGRKTDPPPPGAAP